MLYDSDNNIEIEKPKLNIKKVIIFITIILVCIFVIISSFFVSYKKMHSQNETQGQAIVVDKKDKNNIEVNERKFKIALHDAEKIKSKFIPEQNDNAKEQIKAIYGSDEKQVYLTFDDGPTKTVTPQILDILKQENVPATFFVLGYRVDLNPDLVKREFNEGHYIANHGYSHKYSSIYASPESTWDEFVRCEQSIKNALENPEYNSYLFRFPGGSGGGKYESIKEKAREIFDQNKVAFTNWNCLTGDAAGSVTKEDQLREMEESKGNYTSIILLMHDAADKQVTVETLPEIIKYFRDQGYVFKNFYEIF